MLLGDEEPWRLLQGADWVDLDLVLAPLDDVVEEMWAMLARGDLRLVVDGKRLRVKPFEKLVSSALDIRSRQR